MVVNLGQNHLVSTATAADERATTATVVSPAIDIETAGALHAAFGGMVGYVHGRQVGFVQIGQLDALHVMRHTGSHALP